MRTSNAPAGATLALGFPGQGGDWDHAIATLRRHRGHELVQALGDRLGSTTWEDLDPADTRVVQPVVYVAGLVAVDAVDPDDVVAVVGHSLGEITAAAWVGAVTPEAGLDLVVERAALGHRSQRGRAGAMAAFMRWPRTEVEWLRREVLAKVDGTVLEVAVVNSPTQVVLSGDDRAVELAVSLANERGGVARRLPIGGAYHSSLMVAEVEAFRAAVVRSSVAAPTRPVVSSTACRPITVAGDLVDALVRSLVLPVDWPATVAATRSTGATSAIDAGPGDTLVRLARFLPDLPFAPVQPG